MGKSLAGFLMVVSATGTVATTLAEREAYLHTLVPGASKEQMEAAIGPPDTAAAGRALYRLPVGEAEVITQGGEVVSVDHMDPEPGVVRQMLYWRRPGTTCASLARHESLLAERAFGSLERWGEDKIHTALYPGADCFLLAKGYIVLDPATPLAGTTGLLKDRIARARLYRDRPGEIVWKLFDTWGELQPSRVGDGELSRREALICRYGKTIGRHAQQLGPADGAAGSGVIRQHYYLRDGLLEIVRRDAYLTQPGTSNEDLLGAWLTGHCPGGRLVGEP
jgi:hypothetical protein